MVFQNGIAACLMFIDFFSVVAQRSALMVTANCVQNMTLEEFQSMRESLPVLSGRLSHSVSVHLHLCVGDEGVGVWDRHSQRDTLYVLNG